MAHFRLDSIAELARQMTFAPREVRLAQVDSAEGLLGDIEATKAYPLDFVIFRITGYRPKQVQEGLLTGLALQHDLGLLVEQVSASLQIETASAPVPVLSIDEVATKFKVTSKTIQRWRRKGLAARRFIFPDSKLRVGFLLSSIERFISSHPDQIVQRALPIGDGLTAEDCQRLAELESKRIKFIDDPLYHQDDAEVVIYQIVGQESLGAQACDESRIPRDLPPYLQDLYRTPLLTASQERGLFLKLNFHKYQFVSLRRRIDRQRLRQRDLDALEGHLHLITETRNQILRANLRLVVSVARKHLRSSIGLMELISDGNITLMRAVDGFDIHTGNKFSTYATFALMKGFARSVPQMLCAMQHGEPAAILQNVSDARVNQLENDRLTRDEVTHLLSCLSDRERHVLCRRFGLDHEAPESSLRRLGGRMGLSGLRVGEIQKHALAKLRAMLGP
jgi:RNA polymerase sigma factor (sigma-70 family)